MFRHRQTRMFTPHQYRIWANGIRTSHISHSILISSHTHTLGPRWLIVSCQKIRHSFRLTILHSASRRRQNLHKSTRWNLVALHCDWTSSRDEQAKILCTCHFVKFDEKQFVNYSGRHRASKVLKCVERRRWRRRYVCFHCQVASNSGVYWWMCVCSRGRNCIGILRFCEITRSTGAARRIHWTCNEWRRHRMQIVVVESSFCTSVHCTHRHLIEIRNHHNYCEHFALAKPDQCHFGCKTMWNHPLTTHILCRIIE